MELFLADHQISKTEKASGGGMVLSLVQSVGAPKLGDLVVTGTGTWRVEAVFNGPQGTGLQIRVMPHLRP